MVLGAVVQQGFGCGGPAGWDRPFWQPEYIKDCWRHASWPTPSGAAKKSPNALAFFGNDAGSSSGCLAFSWIEIET